MADQGDSKIKTHSILEDYEVKWNQKLGTGISGPVRPCKSRVTGQQFALKCLHNRPRAWREVNLQMRCSGHPHIVSIIDIYENEVQFPSEPKALGNYRGRRRGGRRGTWRNRNNYRGNKNHKGKKN